MTRILAEYVGFDYPIYDMRSRSLKMSLSRSFVGGSIGRSKGNVVVQALRDINLDLSEGDRLGLVGHNGSGKTTLLRVLAGLYTPQHGRLTRVGRLLPLIEKGVGINPELTGHDNVELPLRLLGATDEEVARARKEIPEFAGLGPFMHLPVRTYSDGMRARLSFSLCTAIHADILVIDEWLSAGDMDFQSRAYERLTNMVKNTGIVVVASHSAQLIQNVCNKAVLLEGGRMRRLDTPKEVCDTYAEGPSPWMAEPVF